MTKNIYGAALFGVGFVIGITMGQWLIGTVRRSI